MQQEKAKLQNMQYFVANMKNFLNKSNKKLRTKRTNSGTQSETRTFKVNIRDIFSVNQFQHNDAIKDSVTK